LRSAPEEEEPAKKGKKQLRGCSEDGGKKGDRTDGDRSNVFIF
jgi:hypothetical protein